MFSITRHNELATATRPRMVRLRKALSLLLLQAGRWVLLEKIKQMNYQKSIFLFLVLPFLIQSCSKDNLKKYEGDYSFTTKVRNYYKSSFSSDTIINSIGTIKELDKSTLEINYMSQIIGDLRKDIFMLGIVKVTVDNDGNISPANGNYGYDISVTGKFEGVDKLSMIIEVNSEQYGKLSTEEIAGIRK